MSKENKTSDKPQNGNDFIADVSGSLLSDDDIKQYFSWGYGGDDGSAIYGAKWARNTIIEEIERRQQFIISEPGGIVRETMIANLLVGLQ